MPEFTLDVYGKEYVIDAPDEKSAVDAALGHYQSTYGTPQQPVAATSPYAESSAVVLPPHYKSSYPGQFRALKYAFRESLPESFFLGVLLGIGIYIVLWIPRLTLRAIRIVKAKPSVT